MGCTFQAFVSKHQWPHHKKGCFAGFAAIVQASSSSRLEILEACSCSIGPDGATSLAEALRAGSSLLVAKLRDNHIGDEGADVLGKALAAGARLHDLDLANNQV